LINYRIYSPSYKRSHVAVSHKLFLRDKFSYVVREEELDKYSDLIKDVDLIPIPQGKVSNISNTRNWILENKRTDYVVMVDDDMTSFNWMLHRHNKKLNPDDIDTIIQQMFLLAEECQAGIWGVNLLEDPKAYRINNPFSFNQIILGPFCAILDTDVRYDETLSLKEDYDFSLQQLKKHKIILRVNFLNYIVDHGELEGGCQTYRNREKEIEQNKLLQLKWGSKIIRPNTANPGSINPMIKTGF